MKNTIKDLREEMGISRAELSRLPGVPARTIQDWELGVRTPRDVYQLLRIAKALKCTVEDIVALDEN